MKTDSFIQKVKYFANLSHHFPPAIEIACRSLYGKISANLYCILFKAGQEDKAA